MAIGWIVGILLFCLMCFFIIYGAIMWYKGYDSLTYGRRSDEEAVKYKKKISNGILSIVLGVSCFFIFVCVPFSFYTVDTGEVAVIKNLGKVKDIREAGTYFDFWMTHSVTKYDAKVQNVPIVTAAYSSDAQTMSIEMNLQYQIYSDKVMEITKQYGSLEALQTRVQSVATERIKSVMSSYKAMDIIAKRAEMPALAEEAIRDAVDTDFHVQITTVAITNIDFSDAFEKAVEDKMIAEQAKLKADFENDTKLAKAKANAEAKVLEAEAEAKANELLQKTLTDKILHEMYLDKWDGKLPQVVAGEDTSMILPSYNTSSENK